MDPYFVLNIVHLKMCQPKCCDKQLISFCEKLTKILMEMHNFIQNLGLLPLVSNGPKIGNFQGNPLTIDQDIDKNVQYYLEHKIIALVWLSEKKLTLLCECFGQSIKNWYIFAWNIQLLINYLSSLLYLFFHDEQSAFSWHLSLFYHYLIIALSINVSSSQSEFSLH